MLKAKQDLDNKKAEIQSQSGIHTEVSENFIQQLRDLNLPSRDDLEAIKSVLNTDEITEKVRQGISAFRNEQITTHPSQVHSPSQYRNQQGQLHLNELHALVLRPRQRILRLSRGAGLP